MNVLAHTIPGEISFSEDENQVMKTHQVALIPMRQYPFVGGTILSGTDVGFPSKHNKTKEHEFMGRAMACREILASLTTNPRKFLKSPTEGRVAKGMRAHLVVLEADAAEDVKNFAEVAAAIRDGTVIYSATEIE